jgi:hypothetical protein
VRKRADIRRAATIRKSAMNNPGEKQDDMGGAHFSVRPTQLAAPPGIQ